MFRKSVFKEHKLRKELFAKHMTMKKTILFLCLFACMTAKSQDEYINTDYNIQSPDEKTDFQPMPEPPAMPYHVWFKEYGWYGVADLFGATDISEEKASIFGISASGGFQTTRATGFGIGFSYINDKTNAYSHLPIFIELRSHYSSKRLTPFSVLSVGYSIPKGGTQKNQLGSLKVLHGGIMFGLRLGFRFAYERKLAFNVFAGYQGQSLYVERKLNPTEEIPDGINKKEPVLLHFISYGVGVNF